MTLTLTYEGVWWPTNFCQSLVPAFLSGYMRWQWGHRSPAAIEAKLNEKWEKWLQFQTLPPHIGLSYQPSIQKDLPSLNPLQPTHVVQPQARLYLMLVKMVGAEFEALESTEDAEEWMGHGKRSCFSIPGEKGWEALKLYPMPREGFRNVCVKQD